jgi:hypothetical protein
MRALAMLVSAAMCACSSARPSATAAAELCDLLPLIGKAVPTALASDEAGGIALAGTSPGPALRAGYVVLERPDKPLGGFVLRTSPAGGVSWIRSLGAVRPLAEAIASDGSVVVVGQAQKQCFAARLDSRDGREIWTSRLTADGESACRAVAVDGRTGEIRAVGEFTGSLGAVRSAGLSDAFMLEISAANGEMRLARTFGGKGADTASAIAAIGAADVLVAGAFGADVDASAAEVNFGRGAVPGAGGADGYLLALSAGGGTRWLSVVGERGDDEVVGVAAHAGAVYAAANAHREQKGAPCGGEVLVLRKGEWVRVLEEECLSARAAAFDDAGRLWMLEHAGRSLRARAFAPRDGEPLGSRTWTGERAVVRGAGIARIPGGFAVAAMTDGEAMACGRPVGTTGEQTAFVVWVRDLG